MEAIANIWHKHPYLIVGACGLVVLYFLWPSSSSSNSSAAQNTDPYGQQLAAETALSQSQLAEQAQVALGSQQEQVAIDAQLATSNEAIAQSNAAAIVSYNQTAQTAITGETNLSIAQTAAGSNDFSALIAGLTSFGNNSENGAVNASANGLNAYLTTIGAQFSDTHGSNSFEAQDSYAGASGVATMGLTGSSATTTGAVSEYNQLGAGFGGGFGTYNQGSGSTVENSTSVSAYGVGSAFAQASAANLGIDVNAVTTPFTNSDNLMGSLWSKAIDAYSVNQASVIKTLPTITPATQPILTGNVQTIG
jgi:hypothetical protein